MSLASCGKTAHPHVRLGHDGGEQFITGIGLHCLFVTCFGTLGIIVLL